MAPPEHSSKAGALNSQNTGRLYPGKSKGILMHKKILGGLVIFALLSVLVAACGIYDTANVKTGPTAHMSNASFVPDTVTIPKGQMLTLIDDVAVPHSIKNGSWVNGQAEPASESGAPTVNQNFTGNDSATIGPFNTAGTFHLYCTIHPGMNLTVKVQ
jgi:plastocyanin